jgi:chromosome segregation protein
MRIKQIELNGFKSFMEPTVLELPKGVTAVVGPNGCGKSNIVDAIRWVLGEQSPKHLRGAAMEDVIFNGNADNGPLGMAEVSLLLERDEEDLARAAADESGEDGTLGEGLPPELANLSEILVTRRYFRSGDSEYFINRAPCRLRDITELFLGTGVGTKAYAIIEQGRVDQLINAKPEDLRLFIEEAAGTTRFRSRKLAAERKMERTRDNLMRVQDILRELERHIASLERQARRAEEYHRVKEELRDLDLRVMAVRREAWVTETDRLRERSGALQAEEAALLEEIRRSRGATSELEARRTANAARLRAVEEELTEVRLRATEAQARVSGLAARVEELTARRVEAEGEAEHLRGRLAELAAEEGLVEADVARLAAEEPAVTEEQRAAESHLETLLASGAPIERAVEEAKDSLLGAMADEVRLRNIVEALQQRQGELEGRRRKLEDEQRLVGERLHANATRAEAARAAIARLQAERESLGQERQHLAAEQRSVAEREERQVRVLEEARTAETDLRSRARSLRELQARYEGCTRGVANLLGRGGEGALLLASVLRVPAELERAVAAALGTRLGQVVVADTPAAVDAIGWLRGTAGGSATVVPRDADRRAPVIVPSGRRLVDQIDVDPQHWALAEALLGHVLLADDLEDAVRLWRAAEHAVTVVTPAGEAIDALGAVSGGSEPPLEETLLARERELRELEQAIAAARAVVTGEEGALGVLRAEGAAIATTVADREARLHAVHVDLVAAEKDREGLDAERERLTAQLEVGALEAGGLAGEDGELAGEVVAAHTRLAAAGGAVAASRERLSAQQGELGRWRESHTAAEAARTGIAVRAAAIRERLRAARAELERCRSARHDLEERTRVTGEHILAARVGADAAREEADAVQTSRLEAEGRAKSLLAEREGLVRAIAEADALVSADSEVERSTRERVEAGREERARIDVALTERRMELEHLAGQLAERYGLGMEALVEVPVEESGQEERAARAESLRVRLTRLGDVNPGAVDELRELEGRHEFLVAQRADLERSLEDLRRTITKLTRTSRQRFEETFAAANEKLAEVFPKLFPGGKARLEMVTLEEGGEPGIEIVVHPAGKKLQSLNLLSGGEKAMTAVALILSLFLIRPTPFCLLDEVDAPLDEANIGRFNQLVREMATASQFVLITHNRRTMEAAETLYGITMEQAGVSKVVSVRLREAA